jgi:hypothetical protein
MKDRHLQLIVVSPQPGSGPDLSTLARVKLIFGALLFAAVAVGVFIFALIVGSLIAFALLTVFLLLALGIVFKAVAQRVRQ